MGKRIFELEFFGTARIELDDAVIEAVDDEWRSALYDLYTAEEIAEMVGRCMICHQTPLSHLDGWADQPDSNAKVLRFPNWETTEVWEVKK